MLTGDIPDRRWPLRWLVVAPCRARRRSLGRICSLSLRMIGEVSSSSEPIVRMLSQGRSPPHREPLLLLLFIINY